MTNRIYRLLVGSLLLIFLYFDLNSGIYFLILLMFLEGISNYLLPDLVNHFLQLDLSENENLAPVQNQYRFAFSSERAWRLVVSVLLFCSYILFNQNFAIFPAMIINDFSYINWFFPWYMGFAILGAGISAVCPVLTLVKWVGFK